jgi:hypothetical protein
VEKEDSLPLPTDNQYQASVGSLIYLAVNARPDISDAIGIVSKSVSCHTTKHWEAGKHVLRYLKGTTALGLSYFGTKSAQNQGVCACELFRDADFAADLDKRRSTTGAVMLMQRAANVWVSKLQSIVATSTAEAEFIAAAMATKSGLWVRKLLG